MVDALLRGDLELVMVRGKRNQVALWSRRLGITRLLGSMPTKPTLLVLNYHRIGNAQETPFDSGVFSATADEFEQHVRFLKSRFPIVTLEEALEWIEGTRPLQRTAVLLTFDDGYLDNYTLAFPILRSLGTTAVFFLVSSYVGNTPIPWWDEIAYMVKHSRREPLQLGAPFAGLPATRTGAIWHLLAMYKSQPAAQGETFLNELQRATEVPRPALAPNPPRLFMNWSEARQMLDGGMAIGSHTVHHVVLSRVPVEQQRQELLHSKQALEQHLGPIQAFAYPVGSQDAFTAETRKAAQEAGYRAAFSYYGGFNGTRPHDRFDVHRLGISDTTLDRFRLQTTVAGLTGSYWF